jgi:hypothetical protein
VAAGLSFWFSEITAASQALAVNFMSSFRATFWPISFVGERIVNPATGEIFL